jgi:hypothetical protein
MCEWIIAVRPGVRPRSQAYKRSREGPARNSYWPSVGSGVGRS